MSSASESIHVILDGNVQGPLSPPQVLEMIRRGEALPETPAWKEGLADWKRLDQLVSLPATKFPPLPPTPQPAQHPSPLEIYVDKSGKHTGPFSEGQIQMMLNSGMVDRTDLAWHEGLTSWLPLKQVIKVDVLFPPLPNPAAAAQTGQPASVPVASSVTQLSQSTGLTSGAASSGSQTVACASCGANGGVVCKRVFFGLKKCSCSLCGADFRLPLTGGLRLTYWVFGGWCALHLLLKIPLLLTALTVSISSSLSDLRIRNKINALRFDMARFDFRRGCFDGPKRRILSKIWLSPTDC